MTDWFETRNRASGLWSRYEEDQDLPEREEDMSDPVFTELQVHIPLARLRNPVSRAELLAAWLIILGRVTESMGGRFVILGAGDILK